MAQHFRQIHAPEESNGTNGGRVCWIAGGWVKTENGGHVTEQKIEGKTPVAKF